MFYDLCRLITPPERTDNLNHLSLSSRYYFLYYYHILLAETLEVFIEIPHHPTTTTIEKESITINTQDNFNLLYSLRIQCTVETRHSIAHINSFCVSYHENGRSQKGHFLLGSHIKLERF